VTIPPTKGLPPVNKRLVVSRASAGFISRGHPWVRPDRFTRGLQQCRVGEHVLLVDDQGREIASALADPKADACARVYHRTPGKPFDVIQTMAKAWTRRGNLHGDGKTTCYRIVHGEGDWLPGLRVDRLGRVVVVVATARCIEPHLHGACVALREVFPDGDIIVREHYDDLRIDEVRSWRWQSDGGKGELDPDAEIQAKELGVDVTLRPFAGLATGIYVDQRGTRQWLRKQAKGKRVLNLFAYTGVFSASLLAANAAQAVDVDISAPALELAQRNNAPFGARYRMVQAEARDFLRDGSDTFDIVICDPPTSAQGDGGWILRRDYPELLDLIWSRLAPGGLLVACCNTIHGKPFPLHDEVKRQAGAEMVPEPPLAEDLPQLPGFPEGRPFRIVCARKA
jgi:23S rRNA (cytosine1962-C5)-methyltransferase